MTCFLKLRTGKTDQFSLLHPSTHHRSGSGEIPSAMISRSSDGTPILQNWDPEGHEPTLLLLEEMYKKGVKYPAVTSMNYSGTPELVTEEEGTAFSEQAGIPLFLTDPQDPKRVQGSYTILGIHQQGVELVRDGNIPASLFNACWVCPLIPATQDPPATHRRYFQKRS